MRWVALLYSVVLTAERRVRAADLIAAGEQAGFSGLRPVLSTGNLILSAEGNEAGIAARMAGAVEAVCGRAIPVFVRSEAAFRALVAENPFRDCGVEPGRIGCRIMAEPIPDEVVAALEGKRGADEGFASRDRALWFTSPSGVADTPLSRALLHPRTGAGTSRNASALAKILRAFDD